MVRRWQLPGGHMPMSTPQNYCHQCLCPCIEPQQPPTSAGDPAIPAGRSGPGSYEVTGFFPWVVHTRPCVPPLRVEFLFPPVLWSSCNQTPLAFTARFSQGSSSRCQTLSLGSLTWGSKLSLLWQSFCGIIILQFVGHPPSGYGI